MVQRSFGGTILPYPIPGLPDGGGSLFDLVEPGRNGVLLEQGISDIQPAVLTEDVTQERGGQKSRAQMIVVFLNQPHQVFEHPDRQLRSKTLVWFEPLAEMEVGIPDIRLA